MFKYLNYCVACGNDQLVNYLDLGNQCLANNYTDSFQDNPKFPLAVNYCTQCFHSQLSVSVDPCLLYSNYSYRSNTSQTLKDYFDWFAQYTIDDQSVSPRTVLDIACNDGSQLDSYKTRGVETWGVDPAHNLYDISCKNHRIVCSFWNNDVIRQFPNQQKFDIITAQNVLGHTSSPREFLELCKHVMHNDTKLYIQTSQSQMVSSHQIDTVYHEHISYFNMNSFNRLVERAGLVCNNVIKTPIHGSSYIFTLSLNSQVNSNVNNQWHNEQADGLYDINTYTQFTHHAHNKLKEIEQTIRNYQDQNYMIIGLGAAAKGMTILQCLNLKIDYILDENQLKVGKYTACSNNPIISIEHLSKINPSKTLFVCLAWNFFDEMYNKIRKHRMNDNDVFFQYYPKFLLKSSQD